ncbi:MAG: B3/B4 domain-containing protein [Candidatus Izemoplasmataceae bacterium]
MKITIDSMIKDKTPDFCIGVLSFDATAKKSSDLDDLIAQKEQEIMANYTLKTLLKTPKILEARNAYKTYGKDPSRYRLAVESLFRRIIKGNKLYRINQLVDIGNYLSLHLKKSTAVLDRNQIQGDVLIRLGKAEPYEGIARGEINIEQIPVYVDLKGPFGSTTSDTTRTMITDQTTSVLVFVISFTGKEELSEELAFAKTLFTQYAGALNIETFIVE